MEYLLLLFCILTSTAAQQVVTNENSQSSDAYLLVVGYNKIFKVYSDGRPTQTLLEDRFGGLLAVDYHYRLNLVFWLTSNQLGLRATLKSANLHDGSNETLLVDRSRIVPGFTYPVNGGLAVDWLNDKLYWVVMNEDRRQTIEEYDIHTGQLRPIYVFEDNRLVFVPRNIIVYPEVRAGEQNGSIDISLYTTTGKPNNDGKSLVKLPVNSTTPSVVYQQGLMCPGGIDVDFTTQRIYFNDYCTQTTKSIRNNGSDREIVVSRLMIGDGFTYGLAVFNKTVYWTRTQQLQSVKLTRADNVQRVVYIADRNQPLDSVRVVHPSKQPDADTLRLLSGMQAPVEIATPVSSTATPAPTTTIVDDDNEPHESSVATTTFTTSTTSTLALDTSVMSSSQVEPSTVVSSMFIDPTPLNERTVDGTQANLLHTLLIYALPPVGGVIIIVTILSLLIIAYCKRQQSRKGSYNVTQVPCKSEEELASGNRRSTASEFLWQEVAISSPNCSPRSSNEIVVPPSNDIQRERMLS